MRQSEKIGYVIEHLLIIELQRRGVAVRRSEQPGNETIRSDLSFAHKHRRYVVFVTHTRTQGMTNRKFYRSFEELAQRRLSTGNDVCIDVSLVQDRAGVRSQQRLIFESLFDLVLHLVPLSLEPAFVSFVNALGTTLSLSVTESNEPKLHGRIRSLVSMTVDKILQAKPNTTASVQDFWELEKSHAPGAMFGNVAAGVSVKKGMKLLALLPKELSNVRSIAKSSTVLPSPLSEDVERRLLWSGTCATAAKSLVGYKVGFSPDVVAAAAMCTRLSIDLSTDWCQPYLLTPGARHLYRTVLAPSESMQLINQQLVALNGCKTKKALLDKFIDDYKSDGARCDFIDVALRSAGFSQNDLSAQVVAQLSDPPHVSDPLVYIIGKNEDADSIIGDVDRFIHLAAELVWAKLQQASVEISAESVYRDRVKTYLAQPYIQPEGLLIERGIAFDLHEKKTRSSVLPRVAGLPGRYRMSVSSAATFKLPSGGDLFVITISTPEERHHKHKEFAGKLRAVRYQFRDGKLVADDSRFLAIVDGNWSADQVGMMVNAGWTVASWEALPEAISAVCNGRRT